MIIAFDSQRIGVVFPTFLKFPVSQIPAHRISDGDLQAFDHQWQTIACVWTVKLIPAVLPEFLSWAIRGYIALAHAAAFQLIFNISSIAR